MIVNRSSYIDQLSRSKGNGLIKIITGLRRSGKSFLLKTLFRKHLLDEGVQEDHIIIIDILHFPTAVGTEELFMACES